MKVQLSLMALLALMLFFPACLPEDEDIDTGDPVEKFLGTWSVNESCRRGNYSLEITRDPGNSAQVLVYNFGNPGPGYDPAVGLVVSNNLHIQSQTIGEGWTVSGKGTYSSNGSITWDYSLVIPPNELNCTADSHRQ